MDKKRFMIGLAILIGLAGLVVLVDALRARSAMLNLDPGDVPLYLDGELVAGFSAADLEKLSQTGFVDAEEGKPQNGWLVRDVLRLYLDENRLSNGSSVIVSSSSRNKQAQLTWAEVDDPANMLLFTLSGRGTLKLVSLLERLDVRDEWVQDVDKIEVITP